MPNPTAYAQPPAPQIDPDSAGYWQGLAEHQLRLPGCVACGKVRFPPLDSCPYCGQPGGEERVLSGLGTVYSFIVLHRTFHPAFEADLPFAIAVVDLEHGPRIAARIEGPPEAVRIGVEVEATYFDRESWTELRFVPQDH